MKVTTTNKKKWDDEGELISDIDVHSYSIQHGELQVTVQLKVPAGDGVEALKALTERYARACANPHQRDLLDDTEGK